ncbi:hypothetical protein HK405_001379, partial [Cladochytrium tenue]
PNESSHPIMSIRPPRRHNHSLMGRRFDRDFGGSGSSVTDAPSLADELRAYIGIAPSRRGSQASSNTPSRRNSAVSDTASIPGGDADSVASHSSTTRALAQAADEIAAA